MKLLHNDLFVSFVSGFVVPAIVLLGVIQLESRLGREEQAVPAAAVLTPRFLTVRFEDGPVSMALEEYLVGVVLAEMPAEFEEEALKAQAVAARTFAWKAVQSGGKHGDGSVCTASSCCQAYRSPETAGNSAALSKIRSAVYATADLVLVYNGELIDATYFSCSGGYTEDAREVWGYDCPYLLAKESPEEPLQWMAEEKQFSPMELEMLLGTTLSAEPEQWFSDWKYTRGGGVSSVVIGNRQFDGVTVRKLLNLRSTLFHVQIGDGRVAFHTEGFGHRVGMSQYGADALAVQGKDFAEILQYYYTGTCLKKIELL